MSLSFVRNHDFKYADYAIPRILIVSCPSTPSKIAKQYGDFRQDIEFPLSASSCSQFCTIFLLHWRLAPSVCRRRSAYFEHLQYFPCKNAAEQLLYCLRSVLSRCVVRAKQILGKQLSVLHAHAAPVCFLDCSAQKMIDDSLKIWYNLGVGFFRQEGGGTRGIHSVTHYFRCGWGNLLLPRQVA